MNLKTLLNIKCVFDFLYGFLGIISYSKKVQQDIITNVRLSSYKVAVILVKISTELEFY